MRMLADAEAALARQQEAKDRADAAAEVQREEWSAYETDRLADAQTALRLELTQALTGKTKPQVVEALLDGTFYPAVCIDWSKA